MIIWYKDYAILIWASKLSSLKSPGLVRFGRKFQPLNPLKFYAIFLICLLYFSWQSI